MMETYRGIAFPWLCDHQGHLTTSQYLLMFDIAAYHLMDRLQGGIGDAPDLGWADVRHEIDYKSEVAVGALVLVRSGVVRLGRTSITHRHVMTSTDGATVHAMLQAVTVRFDRAARSAAPLPELLKANSEPLLISL
jgi:acyl-CoA thioester hydrolase